MNQAESAPSDGVVNPFSRFEKLSPYLARAAFAWGIGQSGWKLFTRYRDRIRERMTYTIKVKGTDEVFSDLHDWLLGLLPEDEQRALIASTGNFRSAYEAKSAESIPVSVGEVPRPKPRPSVRLRYDGSKRQTVELEGHSIDVEVEHDETKHWDKVPENWQAEMQRMVFTAHSIEGRDAVLHHIERLWKAKQDKPGPPPLRMANRWGSSWTYRYDLPPRTIESVILKEGQLERLIADLGEFLASESDYNRLNLPWHRGYLFFGQPGTGKTSVAKALANHFDLPVYYLPMGHIEGDSGLTSLVSDVDPRSVLLMEDVDIFHATTQRDDEDGGVTLSGVLNALDGVWTPHGSVWMLTTNNREVLDDALLRPGRVDCEEEFTNLSDDQAVRLMQWFYPKSQVRIGTCDGRHGDLHYLLDGEPWCYPWQAHMFETVSPAQLIGAMSRAKQSPGEALGILAKGSA